MISEKNDLRRRMRDLRAACETRPALDKRIAQHFLQSELYRAASALLLYASFRTEADTGALIRQALKDQKPVYLPYCETESNDMWFYRITSIEELSGGAFGIPAPKVEEGRAFHPVINAVCVVPGLAFSENGARLGYGRGYYDTFLEKIDVCTVGLCYNFQVTEQIPTEEHDKRMHYLCTENGLFRCGD